MKLLALLLLSLIEVCGTSLYGVYAYGSVDYYLPPNGTNTLQKSFSTQTFLPQTSYSAGINGIGSSAYFEENDIIYTDVASAYVWDLEADNGQLHAWAESSASSAYPGNDGTGAGASARIYWADTIYIGGSSLGSPVVVQLTNVFDGLLTYTGNTSVSNDAVERATLGSVDLLNSYTTAQRIPITTQYGYVDTTVGSTLSLEIFLGIDTGGGNFFDSDADLSDTASVYLNVLTPGASFTSASGLSYSDIPESTTFILVGVGLTAIWRLSRAARCTQPVAG
jgi:hypothetical protein